MFRARQHCMTRKAVAAGAICHSGSKFNALGGASTGPAGAVADLRGVTGDTGCYQQLRAQYSGSPRSVGVKFARALSYTTAVGDAFQQTRSHGCTSLRR